ncbi:MAG: AMP-binding protein [Myxococcales bacterium]|nr:AMP-binding protein [Myxococcales bacterium]
MHIETSDLVLQRAYRWGSERGSAIYMTQPMGGGAVRDYTWARTIDEARRMARHLQSFGFEKGSRIGIVSKNCAHFILSELAIWMAGYVSVAIYPTVNAKTIRYIMEHSESKLLFVGKLDTWDELKQGVPSGIPCISYPLSPKNDFPMWDDIIAKTEPIEGNPTREPDEMALILYTSGSTGQPKGVVHTFRTITSAVKGGQEVFKFNANDRVLSYLPLAHVFERLVVETISLYVGFRIFFAESLDTFVKDVQRARPTLFHSVPRLWLKFQQGVLAKMPQKKLNTLLRIPILSGIVKKKILTGLGLDQARMAVSGSAPIAPELIQWYRDLGLELLEGYAMSENFAYSHVSKPGKARVGYVGNTMPGVDCKISPEGEVLIKSPGNMTGYHREPELTKAAFTEDGYLKTGDRGELDSEGRLKITGRVKELFKTSKGKYVAPVPIENLINAHTHIEMSCVMGSGQPQPFALIMLSETLRKQLKSASDGSLRGEIEGAINDLVTRVNKEIEEWEQLQCVVIVKDEWAIENGFLTPTMKLKRDVVEKAYSGNIDGWYGTRKTVIWHD